MITNNRYLYQSTPCVYARGGSQKVTKMRICTHVHTHTHTPCTRIQRSVGQGRLTHRTCRATAPSVRSLCVNRSVGNSCRAERDRHIWLERFICSMCVCVLYSCVCLQGTFFQCPSQGTETQQIHE